MKRAFTLIELSIALIIIGLLVGGILAGRDLIRAAELRSVTVEFQSYQKAVNTFMLKYDGLPGDIDNAEAIWGQEAAGNAACRDAASTTTATCNGDDNGKINDYSAGWLTALRSNESFRFWQQLSNAGLLEGNYTGAQDGSTYRSTTALNAPTSRLDNGLWFVWHLGAYGITNYIFQLDYGNVIVLGTVSANNEPENRILTPEEMWNLDKKMDDGMPGSGDLVTSWIATCSTASSETDYTATYELAVSTAECVPYFRNVF